MIPDAATLAVFCAASVALYISPGPDMLYIASRSLAGGRRAGVISALGTCTGLLVHTVAAALGLSVLLVAWPLAYTIVKWLGVAYLAFLGVRMLVDRSPHAMPDAGTGRPMRMRAVYAQGALVNLLNPKIAIFFLAFLPQFAGDAGDAQAARLLFLGMLFILGGSVWTLFLAYLFGGAGDWLSRRPAVWKWQRRVSGSILLGLAAHLALSHRA